MHITQDQMDNKKICSVSQTIYQVVSVKPFMCLKPVIQKNNKSVLNEKATICHCVAGFQNKMDNIFHYTVYFIQGTFNCYRKSSHCWVKLAAKYLLYLFTSLIKCSTYVASGTKMQNKTEQMLLAHLFLLNLLETFDALLLKWIEIV